MVPAGNILVQFFPLLSLSPLTTAGFDDWWNDDFSIPPGFGGTCDSPASFLVDVFGDSIEFAPKVCPQSTPLCDLCQYGSGQHGIGVVYPATKAKGHGKRKLGGFGDGGHNGGDGGHGGGGGGGNHDGGGKGSGKWGFDDDWFSNWDDDFWSGDDWVQGDDRWTPVPPVESGTWVSNLFSSRLVRS
jgi:hypothetical protein